MALSKLYDKNDSSYICLLQSVNIVEITNVTGQNDFEAEWHEFVLETEC